MAKKRDFSVLKKKNQKFNFLFCFLVNRPAEDPLAVAIPLGPVASPAIALEEARVPEANNQADQPPVLSITYEGNEEDRAAEIRAIKGTLIFFLNS